MNNIFSYFDVSNTIINQNDTHDYSDKIVVNPIYFFERYFEKFQVYPKILKYITCIPLNPQKFSLDSVYNYSEVIDIIVENNKNMLEIDTKQFTMDIKYWRFYQDKILDEKLKKDVKRFINSGQKFLKHVKLVGNKYYLKLNYTLVNDFIINLGYPIEDILVFSSKSIISNLNWMKVEL